MQSFYNGELKNRLFGLKLTLSRCLLFVNPSASLASLPSLPLKTVLKGRYMHYGEPVGFSSTMNASLLSVSPSGLGLQPTLG
jgi:hypothetical protein